MNTWNLRDEILRGTHRWYVIIAFILIGASVGWGAGYLWPSPYRATVDLYVGLNAYRSPYDRYASALAEQSFRLVDDYKNWQMEQLNALVLTDPYLEEVLIRLGSGDRYWDGITPQDFRKNAEVMWRNVGEWHLVFENDDPQHAVQAVETWGNVILEWVGEAITHSEQVVALDIQMSVLEEQRIENELRLDRLRYVSGQLSLIRDRLAAMADDQPVSSTDHWKILALVSLVSEWSPAWDDLLDAAPMTGATSRAYLEWLQHAQSMVDEALTILPEQIMEIKEETSNIVEGYETEAEKSAGLASTLVIERISGETPLVDAEIRNGTMSLVGGVIGFFAWGIWLFTKINRTKG